jgi:type II secretory pathway component PulF
LRNLAMMSQQQAETRLRMLDVVLTPVIMVFLAIIAGLVIVALLLPLVKLIETLT